MQSIIQVKNLNYSVGNKRILKNINMNIEENSIVGIIGTNASGKTSLLRMLCGELNNHNSITFNYAYINFRKNSSDLIKFGKDFVDYDFIFDDVYHELIFPLENLCYDRELIELTIKELVKYFNCSYILDKKIIDLKEEERTILRILLALIHKPKVVVLDNPFKSMKNSLRAEYMFKLFKYVRENNITLIIASSNLEDILYTDYTYVLDDGEIIIEGNTLEVLEEDVNLKKVGIDLPFMVDLSLMLKFYEILDDVHIDMEKLVDKLWN